MKYLVLTDSYPPEIRSASVLMRELANELISKGNEVTVLTTSPRYNLEISANIEIYKERMVEGEVEVIRINALPHHNVNYLIRGISQLVMPFQFLWKIHKLKIKYDILIIYSPPLTYGLVGVACYFFKKKFILNLQDIFPQNAIDLEILKNRLIIKFFKILEQIVYRYSSLITVHSSGNQQQLIMEYPKLQDKIQIVHNWINYSSETRKYVIQTNYRSRFGIDSKYIAVFAGVMGPSQNLEIILEIAKKSQGIFDLNFLLLGSGSERPKLEALSKINNLNNVIFQDFISQENYEELLNQCDIGLMCLSPQNTTPVVPGKILGYMAASKPVLAFLHFASDGHQIVRDANCGITAFSDSINDCFHALELLMKDSDNFNKLGSNGLQYAQNNFSREICVGKIINFSNEIVMSG